MKRALKIFVVSIVIALLFIGFIVSTSSERVNQEEPVMKDTIRHVGNLSIENETELFDFAQKFGFKGNGTRSDPLVIADLYVDGHFQISNIKVWIKIENVLASDNGFLSISNAEGIMITDVKASSVYMTNVSFASIENFSGNLFISSFDNETKAVIQSSNLGHLSINGKQIYATISNTKITGFYWGVHISGVDIEVQMTNCEIYNNNYGIEIWTYHWNSTEPQIRLFGHGVIFHNNEVGLQVSTWLFGDKEEGFKVQVVFEYSLFEANSEAGIVIEQNVTGVRITNSTFVNNWKHIVDNGFGNTYLYNYYDGFEGPDKDGDGIIDRSYRVDGSSGSFDPKPLINPPVAPRGYKYWWNYFLDATVSASFMVVGIVTILAAKKKWDRSKCLKRYEEVKKIWLQ